MADRIIPAGWGYWDVTHYPYGGCFRRAKQDTPVFVSERGVGKYKDESRVVFTDGRVGVVKSSCLQEPLEKELKPASDYTQSPLQKAPPTEPAGGTDA